MKNSKLMIAFSVVVVTTLILFSCNTPAEKVENAEKNVTEANKKLDKANEEYLEDMANYRIVKQEEIDANVKLIVDYKKQIEKDKKEVRIENQKKVEELEKRNTDLKNKIDNYNETGQDKWENFKNEFNRDFNELKESIKNLNNKK